MSDNKLQKIEPAHNGHCDHHGHACSGHDHSGHGHSGHTGAPFINLPILPKEIIKPPSANKGFLKSIFSKISGKTGDFLEAHRKKILLGTAAACAATETLITNSAPVFSLPLLVAGVALSHDAGEDVLEKIGELKHSQGLSTGVVGTAIGFGHTLAEGAFSLMASFNQSTDMAVASVMGSQPSHILLMAGGAAVIGTLGAGKSTAWKLHAGAMGLLTGAFGAQVASGEFYPAAGAAMIAGGGYYLYRRFKDGQSCAIHGSACSGNHAPSLTLADQNFLASAGYSFPEHNHAHERDHKRHITLKQRLTDPHLLSLGGSVVTLTTAAHVMAHELIDLSHKFGVSETTIGTTIAAISLAAPEIILTWKAAHKGEKELAWGTITGCSAATIGIVGGGLALSGASVPEMLDPATKEGLIHLLGFGGSTAAILVATHPSINKDGKISKIVGAGFLAAYMTYLAASGNVPTGHSHTLPDGTKIHHTVPDDESAPPPVIIDGDTLILDLSK